jgi:hypothetical protein
MGSAPANAYDVCNSISAAAVLSSPPGVPWYSSNWAKPAPKPSTTGLSAATSNMARSAARREGRPTVRNSATGWITICLTGFPRRPARISCRPPPRAAVRLALRMVGRAAGGSRFDTQTMAARNVDGSVVILMSNYAPVQPSPTTTITARRAAHVRAGSFGVGHLHFGHAGDAGCFHAAAGRARAAIARPGRADAGHAAGLWRGALAPVQRPAQLCPRRA